MKSRAIFSVILLHLLLLLLILSPTKTNAVAELAGTKICLDPGHGGTDPGAVNSTYNLKESDINLEVSYGLRYLLEDAGAEVVMTRSGDEYLTNSDRYTFCNAEQATILISVHTNSHTDVTWDGSMALYGPRESPMLAQTIYDEMFPYLHDTAPEGVVFNDYGLDHFASGVLFKSDMPSAMMEPLLMSNDKEAPLLVEHIFVDFDSAGFNFDLASFTDNCADFSCRRGQIARSIFQGTIAYFTNLIGSTMHVEDIAMTYDQRGRNYGINTAVTIYDGEGQPVPAAEVTLQVIQLPDGTPVVETVLADAGGVATFRTKVSSEGQYQAAVLDVTKADRSYDVAANVESSALLTIP